VTSTDWLIVAGIAGWLIFIALLVIWSLLRRPPDPRVQRLRVGVFVERDRRGEATPGGWGDYEEQPTIEYPPPKEQT
jgi:hypothetical protein